MINERMKFMCKECCQIRTKPEGSTRKVCYTCQPKSEEDVLLELRQFVPKQKFVNNPFGQVAI